MMFARRAGVVPTESRTPRAAAFLHRFLCFADAELPHGRVRRCAHPFSRAGGQVQRAGTSRAGDIFSGASGWALSSLARRSNFRSVLPVVTLTLTQFLWFLLPAVIEFTSGREVPQTRYSSGLLAVLHSRSICGLPAITRERKPERGATYIGRIPITWSH